MNTTGTFGLQNNKY